MARNTADKVLENKLRLIAKRRGLFLSKSRRRDPFALDFGYELRDAQQHVIETACSLTRIENLLALGRTGRKRLTVEGWRHIILGK
jgi:hypothetical protein